MGSRLSPPSGRPVSQGAEALRSQTMFRFQQTKAKLAVDFNCYLKQLHSSRIFILHF